MVNSMQNYSIQPNKGSFLCRLLLFFFAAGLNIDSFRITLFGLFWMSPVTLIGLSYLLFCSPYIFQFSGIYRRYNKIVLDLIILFLLLIINNVVNLNDISNVILPNDFLFCIILFFVTLCHLERDAYAYKYLLGGIVFGGLLAVLLFNLGIGVEYDTTMNRLLFFGLNPNNMGCMICITFSIIMYYYVIICDFVFLIKSIFILFLLPCLMMIFATGSRTAFFALIMVVVTVVFHSGKGLKTGRKIILWLLLLLGVYYGYRLLASSEVMISRLLLTRDSDDFSGRDIIWSRLIPLFINNPFGIGQTGYMKYTFQNFYSIDINGAVSPHNVFLEIAIYTGFIGLFVYVYFMVMLFKSSINKFREENNLLPLLIFEILIVQMSAGQLLNFKMAWLFFAYIISHGFSLRLKCNN